MNQLIINTAHDLYLKHRGQNHRQIEKEMHDLGCRRFSRRRLYSHGIRPGWIEKYGWKKDLDTKEGESYAFTRDNNSPDTLLDPTGRDQGLKERAAPPTAKSELPKTVGTNEE